MSNDLRREINEMEPGNELDAFVAEKVMGFRFEADKAQGTARWVGYGAYGEQHTPPMAWQKWGHKMPPYSTDISAAWEVVEKMCEKEDVKFGIDYKYTFPDKFVCGFNYNNGSYAGHTSENASEAICKAALKVVIAKGENAHEA